MKTMLLILIILFLVYKGAGAEPERAPAPLYRLIEYEARVANIPTELVYAVIYVESSGNPLARSRADCRGLMQVSRVVWNIFMEEKDWRLAYDPKENVRCGIRYLGDLYKMYNSWEKTLRHYHSGNPNSKRRVTVQYTKKVLKRAWMLEDKRHMGW